MEGGGVAVAAPPGGCAGAAAGRAAPPSLRWQPSCALGDGPSAEPLRHGADGPRRRSALRALQQGRRLLPFGRRRPHGAALEPSQGLPGEKVLRARTRGSGGVLLRRQCQARLGGGRQAGARGGCIPSCASLLDRNTPSPNDWLGSPVPFSLPPSPCADYLVSSPVRTTCGYFVRRHEADKNA